MYLKKQGSALMSTVIILALISTIGCLMFKMMINNKEMSSLYEFDKDIYDLDKVEEESLYNFMKKLNEDYRSSKLSEEDSNPGIMFTKSFKISIDNNNLDYNVDKNKLFLTTLKYNDITRKREIIYTFKKDKIILIPTYKFQNSNE